jgi:hypothetical protein
MLSIALAAQLALAPPGAAPAPMSQAGCGRAAAAGETNANVQEQLPLVTFVVPGHRDMPIVLPEDAVLSDDRGNFVFIIDDNDTIVRCDVMTVHAGDRGVAIVRGLDGDERVVDKAGAFLNPGERVRPARAQPAPRGMAASQAIEIANAEVRRALPRMDRSSRTIWTDELAGKWLVTYASPDDADAGGPVIVDVDKRTGRATIVRMPQ